MLAIQSNDKPLLGFHRVPISGVSYTINLFFTDLSLQLTVMLCSKISGNLVTVLLRLILNRSEKLELIREWCNLKQGFECGFMLIQPDFRTILETPSELALPI